jgi:DNA repair protein RadA/Sms
MPENMTYARARSTRRDRSAFACTACGNETAKWAGRCPACQAWNTLVEWAPPHAARPAFSAAAAEATEISKLDTAPVSRLPVGDSELDRVLGGGLVPGSLVLLGGDPGIGKSTLILQAAASLASGNAPVMYLAGEESPIQVRMRAARLGLAGDGLFVYGGTDLDEALLQAGQLPPALLVVDSIQTVHCSGPGGQQGAPGSQSQLKECTMLLMRWAKEAGVAVVLIGHVTKDGDVAGPRLLEHIVDAVLYLEGERFSSYRLLRGAKNRFGSTNEVGVYEMAGDGLRAVPNPSEAFIAERGTDAVGSCVVPVMEGSRPVLVEVQALTSPTVTPAPRRTANGLDNGRLVMISAVLGRRLGLPLAGQDVIASVVGGLRISEPAADLALALAIFSSHSDIPVPADMVALGEVGLTGELRSVRHLERRLLEAGRMGFRRCLLPEAALNRQEPETSIALLPASSLREAVRLLKSG